MISLLRLSLTFQASPLPRQVYHKVSGYPSQRKQPLISKRLPWKSKSNDVLVFEEHVFFVFYLCQTFVIGAGPGSVTNVSLPDWSEWLL